MNLADAVALERAGLMTRNPAPRPEPAEDETFIDAGTARTVMALIQAQQAQQLAEIQEAR